MSTENMKFIQRQAMLAGGQHGYGTVYDVTLNLVPEPENQDPYRPRPRFKDSTVLGRALAILSGDDDD